MTHTPGLPSLRFFTFWRFWVEPTFKTCLGSALGTTEAQRDSSKLEGSAPPSSPFPPGQGGEIKLLASAVVSQRWELSGTGVEVGVGS